MKSFVALARAINVGKHQRVSSAELRKLFETLSLSNVRSILQSGNFVFESKDGASAAELEVKLETVVKNQLKVNADFFIRSAKQWHNIIQTNPFAPEAATDPSHVVLMLLKKAPAKPAQQLLSDSSKGTERFKLIGRELYIHYPDGIGTSRFTSQVVEKHLQSPGTARNWNTVLKLAELL